MRLERERAWKQIEEAQAKVNAKKRLQQQIVLRLMEEVHELERQDQEADEAMREVNAGVDSLLAAFAKAAQEEQQNKAAPKAGGKT